MKIVRTLVLGLLLLWPLAAVVAGTTGKIVGHVKDTQTNEPLLGVNVVIEGTTLGASTNL